MTDPTQQTGIGRSVARLDAEAKTNGAARYPGDRWPDRVAHAVIVFTDQPHARITRLDTVAAESADGVLLVLTAADVPINEYGLTMNDQPVLVGPVTTGRSKVPATCPVGKPTSLRSSLPTLQRRRSRRRN